MANALGTLFGDIADAIREKNGETAAMKPIEFPDKIRDIVTGSPDGNLVRWITFMSHDGTIEYGKRAVIVGDDCPEPVEEGLFETPIRESDVVWDYTFRGWSILVNGGLSPGALMNITEDKTLYAYFGMEMRFYDISYYDGDTLLKTESVKYGNVPTSYTPAKEGYQFVGWDREVTAVDGPASYYAQWTTVLTFANATWDQIAEFSAAGTAEEHFQLNDTKDITLNFSDGTAETVTLRIIGFNHDDLTDGSGKAGITIACKEGMINPLMIPSTSNSGAAWDACVWRSILNSGEGWNALPADLKTNIKSVTKISNKYETSSHLSTNDKVWLLSWTELGFAPDANYCPGDQGEMYPVYTYAADKTAAHSDKVVKTTKNASCIYATRSHWQQYYNSFAIVQADGSYRYASHDNPAGYYPQKAVFGFCI